MPRKRQLHTQCEFRSQLNRRCHMLLAPDPPTLCTFHARAEAKARQSQGRQAAAAELLAGTESFSTPAAVNLFLGNLLKQLAQGRITRRQATSMAYISQLLLNSLSVMHRQEKDAQAAAQAAAANEPQRVIVGMPRPHRRHMGEDDEDCNDHDLTHAASSGQSNGQTNGNNGGLGASEANDFARESANVSSAQIKNERHPERREGPAFHPASSDVHDSAPSPTPQSSPVPPAAQVLSHLHDQAAP